MAFVKRKARHQQNVEYGEKHLWLGWAMNSTQSLLYTYQRRFSKTKLLFPHSSLHGYSGCCGNLEKAHSLHSIADISKGVVKENIKHKCELLYGVRKLLFPHSSLHEKYIYYAYTYLIMVIKLRTLSKVVGNSIFTEESDLFVLV